MTGMESDEQFVADMEWLHSHDREAALPPEKLARLFALARRGAAVQWRPIEEDYEGEVLLWPRGSAVPSHFLPIPPPPKGADELLT